jgi:hypothetical protein
MFRQPEEDLSVCGFGYSPPITAALFTPSLFAVQAGMSLQRLRLMETR